MSAECKDIQARVHQSCMVMVRPSLLPSTLLPSALPPREQRRRAVILRINLCKRLEVSRLCCAALGGACGKKGVRRWRHCGTLGRHMVGLGGGCRHTRWRDAAAKLCSGHHQLPNMHTCAGWHVLALSSATHGRPQIVANANDAHQQTWRAPSPMQ